MKKRILSLFLAVLMVVGMIPVTGADAASSLEEAMKNVNVYADSQKLNWLTMNGTIRDQEYTYYLYDSPQTGATEEIPAYCVDPRLYGVPWIKDHNGSVDSIRYGAESTVTDPKVCGIISSGYPHTPLETLGLANKLEAYYATKTALWCYLLGNWSTSNLGINPNLTGADRTAAQRVLEATKTIYTNGMAWNKLYIPKLTATPDRSLAYEATVNGESCYQQVFTIDSESWPLSGVSLSLAEGAPSGVKIMNMNNQEISEIALSTERIGGGGYQAKVKLVYPKSAIEGQTGTCQMIMDMVAVDYKIFYAKCLETDKYGNLQNYMLDTDPSTQISSTAVSSYSSEGGGEPEPEPGTPYTPDTPGGETQLRIVKRESGSDKPLAGAWFKILYPDGSVVGTYPTDSEGMITIPLTVTGNYTVIELSAPADHLLSEEPAQNVTVVMNETATVTIYNDAYGALRVHKTSNTGDNLEGVTVTIKNLETGETRTARTAAGGIAEFTELKPGGYEVKETAGIPGYVADVEATKTATVVSGETSEVTFINTEEPGLKIVKYDRKTLQTMPDISFQIWRDGNNLGIYKTDQMGEIVMPNLTPGTYLIKEVQSDDGHIADPTPQQIELKAGDGVKQVLFYNDQKPGIHLVKVDSQNPSKAIPNVKFSIEAVDGSFGPSEYTTDQNGEIDLSHLSTGAYVVTEVSAPDGYLIDNASRIIELEANKTAQFVFTNTKKPTFELYKYDPNTGKYLAGATFRIAKIEDGTHYLDRVTDTQGRISVEGLEPGVYSVREIAAPAGYVLNDTEYHVELFPGRTSELVVNNEKKPDLKIIKTDAITGRPVSGVTITVKKVDSSTLLTDTTDRNGEIFIEQLDPGVYEVWEQSVPDDYLIDETHQHITLFPNKTGIVQFQNYKKPTVTVKKIDSETGRPVEGARFHVTYGSNSTFSGEINDLGEYYTDANGEFKIEKLIDGWYKFQEVEAPKGYRIKDDGIQEVYISAGHDKVLTFENIPLSTILIQKMDEETGKPLSGAWFRMRYLNDATSMDGTTIGEWSTDEKGQIEVTGLDEGTYVVDEISAPAGYVMNAANTRTVYLAGEAQDFITITYGNQKMGGLLIKKKDALTGAPLANVEFFVTDSDGAVVGSGNGKFVTDSAGSILIPNLEPGKTIVAKETRTIPGYILDDAPQTVKIKANETVYLEFRNQPKGTLIVQKIDSATGSPLTGAEFKIVAANGELTADNEGLTSSNGLYTVDRNGQIVLEKLNPGTYVVTETKAPEGYVLNNKPQAVVVNAADTQTLTFANPPKGSLTIHKLDALTRQPLQGVQFKITYADGRVVEQGETSTNGLYSTDKNGQIILSNITGTLVVNEVQTVSGYVIDPETRSQTVVVRHDDAQSLTFYNQPKGSLLVEKYDKVTNQPLAGAEFKITTSDGKLVASNEGLTSSNGIYVTDQNGQIALTKLSPATYIVTETKAPDGYALDSQTQTVVVDNADAQTVRFFDEPLATLTLLKRDAVSKLPLANAEFTVKTADGTAVGTNNGIFTTDSNGTATITGIEPNTALVVSEDSAPAGYVTNSTPQTIIVKSGIPNSLTFDNTPTTTLRIHKYVDGTRNEPISGVGFKVVDSKGGAVGPDDGVYYTNFAGEIVLTGLEPGITVTAREIKTVDGFVLDGTPQQIKIENYQEQELTFWNQRQGTLKIRKLDSETRKPIANTEFKVAYADGRNADTAGGKLSSNGQYFTDMNGEITITNVTGTYVVSEVNPAPGYTIDPEQRTQTVVVNPNDTQTVTFFNTPTQTLVVQKYVAGTTTPIEGCKFLVSYSNGTLIGPANGEYLTDRNGRITISGLEAGATVKVKEIQTTADYVLDSTTQSIEIREGEVQTLTFYNQAKGSLIVRKLDGATKAPLSGAEFKIVTASGEPVIGFAGSTGEDGFYATDKTGQITLAKLAPGTYIVTETKAPDGYVLNSKPQTVVLGAGEAKTVTVENLPKGNLIIQKYDSITRTALAGAEFKVTTASGEPVADHGGKVTTGGSFVTDSNGQITLAKLDPGVYIVTETKAPDNYHLNSTAQTVEVLANDTQRVSFYNDPLATLTVTKVDALSKKPLAKAEFTVTDSEGTAIGGNNGLYLTGTDGTFTVSGLAPDTTLVVTEKQAPSEYVREVLPQTIKVRSGVANSLVFEDQPTATLVIRKYIDGTANEPLSGIGFKITDGSGKAVGPDDGVYYTDHAGEIRLSGLEPGITVKAREIKTVEGFVLDGTPQDVQMQAGQEQVLTFWNKRQGALTVRKLDSSTSKPLEGVEFKITMADGSFVPDKDGKVSSNGIYFTDASGEIILTGVSGTLVVTEVKTIDGYTIQEKNRTQTVVVRPDDVQTLTFFNDPTQTLTIHKYVAGTTDPLEGVTFKVTSSDGSVIGSANGEYTTDRSGEITITGLVPGTTITAKEIRTVSGFVLDSRPQSILIKSGEAQSLNFYNERKGSLIVEKRDSVTGEVLPGAEFKITTLNGTVVDDNEGATSTQGLYTTDAQGRITLNNLNPDSYVVRETKAPEGYVISGETKTVKVNANDTQTVTFMNTPKQSVVIEKYEEGTNKPLAGVTFLVTDSSGAPIGSANGEHVTDENGRIVLTGLTPGMTLIAREVRTVKGYQLSGAAQIIVVGADTAGQGTRSLSALTSVPMLAAQTNTATSGAGNTLTFYDAPLSKLIIHKYIKGTANEPLSGVAFKVTDGNGGAVGPNDGVWYTNAQGEITIPDLEAGTILTVREVETVNGFVLNGTPKQVQIKSSDVHELVFWNSRQGALTVRKLDSKTQQPLEGVTFKITMADGSFVADKGGKVSSNGIYKTDAAGEIVLTGVTGTLIVTEVQTIFGYVIRESTRSQTVVVQPDDVQTLTFYNDPVQSLTINKYIAGTTTPIEGVRFLVTSSDGSVIGSANGEFTTDRNGQIKLTNLVPGTTVTAKEIETVSGFVLNSTPQSILIKSGEAQSLNFFNERKGTLTVEKRDSESNEPLAGAEFKITTLDGALVDDSEGATSTRGIYKTDANGQIVLRNLTPDSYVVRETKAPEGYILDSESQTVRVNANDAQTITFTNTAKQSIVIQKYENGTDKPLPGVTFLVTDASGAPVGSANGEHVTDANGRITLTGLTPGMTLIAREVRTVKGYTLNGAPQTIVVGSGAASSGTLLRASDTPASGNTFTFYDDPLSTLIVQKYIEGTTTPIKGVRFLITDGSGAAVGNTNGEHVTDENGRITLNNLEPGTVITAKEIKAADGYVLNSEPKYITIKSGDVQTLTFYNVSTGALIVELHDSATGAPLKGADFQIMTDSGEFVANDGGRQSSNGVFTTNENGQIIVTGLQPAALVVKEISAPEGYILDNAAKTVRINASDTQTISFKNVPKQTLTIQAYEAGTTTALQGVHFLVTDSTGAAIGSENGSFVTDKDGRIVITGLTPGVTITAKETESISGYVLNSQPQSILIKSGDAQTLTYYNQRKGALVVEARDSATNEPLANAEFKITTTGGKNVDDNEGATSTNGVYKTDANGQITLLNLAPASYVIRQTQAPDGYVIGTELQSVKVDANDAQTITFTDTEKQTLTIQAYEAGTTTALVGIHFLITDSTGAAIGTENGSFVTDKDGRIVITGLTPGVTITAKETESISGYVLNSQPQSILIKSGDAQTLTYYNQRKGALTVEARDSATNEPLANAEFKITTLNGTALDDNEGATSTNGIYKSDANGQIVLTNIAPDSYLIRATKAPDGYVIETDQHSVKVGANDTQTISFAFTAKQSIVIQKYEDGTTKPLAGVTFLVTDTTGAPVGSANGEHVTDTNGRIVISGLTPGLALTVREVRTIKGYTLNGEPQTIIVGSGSAGAPATVVSSAQAASVTGNTFTFYDAPLSVLIVHSYVDGTDNQPLPGVGFKITDSSGAAVGPDGGIYYADQNGDITLRDLEPGVTLTVREIKTVDGYVLNGRPQQIVIQSGDVQNLTFRNTAKQALTIQALVDGSTTPIKGVRFLVTDSNGDPVGNTNGEYVTDENGRIVLVDITPGTIITAKEIRVADGYAENTESKSITIQSGEAQVLTFYNSLDGTLVVELHDGATDAPLKGAEFQIMTDDGAYLSNDGGKQSSNGIFVTDEKGQITVTGLQPAALTIKEITAPSGYVLDGTPKTVRVSANNTQTVVFKNTAKQALTIQA